MDEHSGRDDVPSPSARPASPPLDPQTGGARPPAEPLDPLTALCAAHGPVDSSGHFPSGTIFGDWRVTAFIGRGGNGEVYCAEHITLGTPAAVKVLVREEERAKARFTREATLLSSLKSDAFPRFFAYGEANGHLYLAMELLEPGDLPTGDKAVSHFLLKVCDAVAELHAHGYVHRDIKPSNILRRTGTTGVSPVAMPVLADLGLVKDVTAADAGHPTSDVTLGGVGTPGYGAPEQMERGEATVASDIHALGILADHCFDGKPPRAWSRIIQRATSSLPAQRYPSVAAFARAIRQRHRGIYLIGAFVFLLVLTCVWSVVERPSTERVAHEFPQVSPSPKQVARAMASTNQSFPRVMRLEKKTVVLSDPVVLEAGKEYQIVGPGTLDVDLYCPTTTIVRLQHCVLLNRTKRLYPANGIQYRLEGEAYLNFIEFRKKPWNVDVRDFTGVFNKGANDVRFGGPETLGELIELRQEENRELFDANIVE